MEFKLYSKTHPDYFILVSGDKLDLSLLNKVEKSIDFHNHLEPKELNSKLTTIKPSHLYTEWLNHHIHLISKLIIKNSKSKSPKDLEIPDVSFFKNSKLPYKPIQVKEKKVSAYTKIENIKELSLDFISLDVETTGLNRSLDSVIQFSAVKYKDGKEVAQFDYFVSPSNNKPIEKFTTELTGITQENVDSAPDFKTVWNKFINEFYSGEQLVGQNLLFDLEMLSEETKKIDESLGPFIYGDTFWLTKKLYPHLGRGNYKLEELKKRFLPESISELDSHNSLNDCLIAGELYLFLLKDSKK